MNNELDTPVHRTAEVLGQIDRLEDGTLIGWVAAADRLQERLKVELLVDGAVALLAEAGEHRQDVEDAGIGDGCFGFRLCVPPQFADSDDLTVTPCKVGFLVQWHWTVLD